MSLCAAACLAFLPARGLAAPDPDFSYLDSISYSGTGCRLGSVGSSFSPERTSLTLIFDSFVAQSGPGLLLSEAKTDCELLLNLKAPSGWAYTAVELDLRGYTQLPASATASVKSELSLGGSAASFEQAFTGPVAEDYLVQGSVRVLLDAEACQQSGSSLAVRTSLEITADSAQQASLTLDGLKGALKHGAGNELGLSLVLSPCPPPKPTLRSAVDPEPNAAGWHREEVDVSFVCESPIGIDSAQSSFAAQRLSVSGPAQAACVDLVGVREEASLAIKIDRVAPQIEVVLPQEGAAYVRGEKLLTDFACTDEGSGVASCVASAELDTQLPGVFTFKVDATDVAGNAKTHEVRYRVAEPGDDLSEDAGVEIEPEPDADAMASDGGDAESAPVRSKAGCSLSPRQPSEAHGSVWTLLAALGLVYRARSRRR